MLLEQLNLDPKTLLPLDLSCPPDDGSDGEKPDSVKQSSEDSFEMDDDENSDAEDVFLTVQPSAIANETLQGRRHIAIRYLEELLKDEVTMPPPTALCSMDNDTDLESGIFLPLWHCPFRDCHDCWQSHGEQRNHEKAWWQHVWHTPTHKFRFTHCGHD